MNGEPTNHVSDDRSSVISVNMSQAEYRYDLLALASVANDGGTAQCVDVHDEEFSFALREPCRHLQTERQA